MVIARFPARFDVSAFPGLLERARDVFAWGAPKACSLHITPASPSRLSGALILYGGFMADVTFLSQKEPVDEYGRALYAVSRSIVRALLDQLSPDDLTDLNTDRMDVTLRQLAKVVRLDRDKGMRGDGFEWAVHEAIVGEEPKVIEPVADALGRACVKLKGAGTPESLLFGYERARYLGFLDAVIEEAGEGAILLPDGSGKPFHFGPWVTVAAQGSAAESELGRRIKKVWKTDLFLTVEGSWRWAAATIKSNWKQLEDGPGLRVAIVPEAKDLSRKRRRHQSLHLAVLPDPDGFIGLFNDAYEAMAQAICAVGRQQAPPYWTKPSAQAQRVQERMEKYGTVKVTDIEGALNEAAQQRLIGVENKLVSVEPPPWLHITEHRTPVLAPKPSFEKLD
jgi:hypothetical protein